MHSIDDTDVENWSDELEDHVKVSHPALEKIADWSVMNLWIVLGLVVVLIALLWRITGRN